MLALVCAAAYAAHDGELVKLPITEQQDIRFKRLSMANGLSLSNVNTMIEDDQGFMWFGTGYGLYRYDGYKFKLICEGKTTGKADATLSRRRLECWELLPVNTLTGSHSC